VAEALGVLAKALGVFLFSGSGASFGVSFLFNPRDMSPSSLGSVPSVLELLLSLLLGDFGFLQASLGVGNGVALISAEEVASGARGVWARVGVLGIVVVHVSVVATTEHGAAASRLAVLVDVVVGVLGASGRLGAG